MVSGAVVGDAVVGGAVAGGAVVGGAVVGDGVVGGDSEQVKVDGRLGSCSLPPAVWSFITATANRPREPQGRCRRYDRHHIILRRLKPEG